MNENLPPEHHAFKMGVMRAKARFNHHTRRQARKATDRGLLDTYAAGYYIQKMLHFLFVANNHLRESDHITSRSTCSVVG